MRCAYSMLYSYQKTVNIHMNLRICFRNSPEYIEDISSKNRRIFGKFYINATYVLLFNVFL